MKSSITDVPGIKVGHATNKDAGTGCSVVLCGEGMVCGVDVRGGAPGTRETDALNPTTLVQIAHAVYLGGGSAFGLDGAAGVMQYCEENRIGFDVGATVVPIVPGAVLIDLNVGRHDIRPDKAMGYQACLNATDSNSDEGCIGAATGSHIGLAKGPAYAMKGGMGTSSFSVGELVVGALVAVNCFGNVIDPETGEFIAGPLSDDKQRIENTSSLLASRYEKTSPVFDRSKTTLGIIATNAKLTQPQACRVAMMAHDGFARAINPIHTLHDGDTIFCISTGELEADVTAVGTFAGDAMTEAIIRGTKAAESLYGFPAASDLAAGK